MKLKTLLLVSSLLSHHVHAAPQITETYCLNGKTVHMHHDKSRYVDWGKGVRVTPGECRVSIASKPYIIVLEHPTNEDTLRCRKDENCMDIMKLSDLPEREQDGFQQAKFELLPDRREGVQR